MAKQTKKRDTRRQLPLATYLAWDEGLTALDPILESYHSPEAAAEGRADARLVGEYKLVRVLEVRNVAEVVTREVKSA
jgi:hypothetical protein